MVLDANMHVHFVYLILFTNLYTGCFEVRFSVECLMSGNNETAARKQFFLLHKDV
jgi:hypothetical protein